MSAKLLPGMVDAMSETDIIVARAHDGLAPYGKHLENRDAMWSDEVERLRKLLHHSNRCSGSIGGNDPEEPPDPCPECEQAYGETEPEPPAEIEGSR